VLDHVLEHDQVKVAPVFGVRRKLGGILVEQREPTLGKRVGEKLCAASQPATVPIDTDGSRATLQERLQHPRLAATDLEDASAGWNWPRLLDKGNDVVGRHSTLMFKVACPIVVICVCHRLLELLEVRLGGCLFPTVFASGLGSGFELAARPQSVARKASSCSCFRAESFPNAARAAEP